jgi:hypothetical protein
VLSRSVTRFTLAYRDEDGVWQDKWDAREAGGLPTAVRVELAVAGLPRTDAGAGGDATDGKAGAVTTAVRSTGVRGERGVALIVVLLLLGLLLTIVAEFAQAMRLEAVTALQLPLRRSPRPGSLRPAYQRRLAEAHARERSTTSSTLSGTLCLPPISDRHDHRATSAWTCCSSRGRLSYRVTDETARHEPSTGSGGTS